MALALKVPGVMVAVSSHPRLARRRTQERITTSYVMERAVPPDRALYVPKAKRALLESKDQPSTSSTSNKRVLREDDNMSSTNDRLSSSSEPTPSVAEKERGAEISRKDVSRGGGIYVPRGRRELNERMATQQSPAVANKTNSVQSVFTVAKTEGGSSVDSSTSSPQTADLPAVESLDIASQSASTAKSRDAPRGGIYVPRGRRELNEKKALEAPPRSRDPPSSSSAASHTKADSARPAEDGEEVVPPIKPKLSAYTKWDDDSSDDDGSSTPSEPVPPPSQEETIGESCLLLTGVPAEMSDVARSNIVRAYLDKGATVRWQGTSECLIVFKTPQAASAALPPLGASIFRVIKLRDVPAATRTNYIESVRDLFAAVKPERDSTVATRLIGAALGIRLPAPTKSAAAEARSKARAPSPPRPDAWD